MSYDENRISDLIDGGIQKENELFKGTKGKWEWDFSEEANYASLYVMGKGDILNMQPMKENTLYDINLASSAPEMLEMLQKVLEINKHHNFNGHLINEQIEQLIKQATEL